LGEGTPRLQDDRLSARHTISASKKRTARKLCKEGPVPSIGLLSLTGLIEKRRNHMSFNKITIVGYLGRDPELKYTPQGTAFCKLSAATTERRKNSGGEYEDHTTWFRVTVWGRQAELANEYLSKGRQVYLEGRLRLEEYTDREGNPRTSMEVNATDIQFLGSRNETSQKDSVYAEQKDERVEVDDAPAAETVSRSNKRGGKRAAKAAAVSEEEIPF
jgi:single-strand DNA-binding protein